MPSERAKTIAEAGPFLAMALTFFTAVPVTLLKGTVDGLVSSRQYWLLGSALMAVLSASFLYQGLFMLVYPETTVEEGIMPPVTSHRTWVRELFKPETAIGARLIGALGACSSLLGFFLAGLFAFGLKH